MGIQCDWALIWTVIGAAVATVTLIYGFLRNFKSDIEKDIHKLENDFQRLEKKIDVLDEGLRAQTSRTDQFIQTFVDDSNLHKARTDKLYQTFIEDSNLHKARTDQLYQMFIDLLKAQNPKSNP